MTATDLPDPLMPDHAHASEAPSTSPEAPALSAEEIAEFAVRPGEALELPSTEGAERVALNPRVRQVLAVGGGDWAEVVARRHAAEDDELMVMNMGPQHPSTHGVLRLVLELRGEEVVSCKPVIGYLHTGIEKSTEFRTWTQAVTLVTRADYLSPLFNETVYCLGVERLLDIEAPPRAQALRVLMLELNRVASHLVWVGTTAMELGALSMMLYGFREREQVLDLFEEVTGLRMNHAWVRPGGVSQDLPPGIDERIRAFVKMMHERLEEYEDLLTANRIWLDRTRGVGYLSQDDLIALGVTGPMLRASGLAHDIRKAEPYCGYEQYDFAVPIATGSDVYARYLVRMAEMRESLRIIEQAVDGLPGGPHVVDDPKLAWPAKLRLGPDGLGNSLGHVGHIMGESMEALIHHFKLVTEGFSVPAGEVYQAVESPRGELGCHVVSDGGNLPYRVHLRDPSFVNLQAGGPMSEGGSIADVIAVFAALDPVMGGVDR